MIENAAREPEVVDLAECLDQDGREDRGRRHAREIVVEGVARLARRHPRGAARPDRDRHLRHGGGHDRRRRRAREHPAGPAPGRPRRAGPGRAPRSPPTNGGIRVRRNGDGIQAGRRDHRSVPGLPDRPPGAVHGPDDPGQGHLAHPRDDLREPLHARAGAGPPRRPDPPRRRQRLCRRRRAASRARR